MQADLNKEITVGSEEENNSFKENQTLVLEEENSLITNMSSPAFPSSFRQCTDEEPAQPLERFQKDICSLNQAETELFLTVPPYQNVSTKSDGTRTRGSKP